MNHARLLISASLVITLLTSIPPADATAVCNGYNGTEDFEGYPLSFPQPGTQCWWQPYNNNGASSLGYVVGTPVHAGTRAWYHDTYNSGFKILSPFPCAASVANAPITYDFWFNVGALPATNNRLLFGVGAGYNLAIKDNGIPELYNNPTSVAFAGATAISTSTWYHATITWQDTGATDACGNPTVSASITGTGYGPFGNFVTAATTAPSIHQLYAYNWNNVAASNPTGLYFDDIRITGYPTYTPGLRFCADVASGSANNWGYDYKEDVIFDDIIDSEGISINDGFIFSLPSGDQGYLGKGFNPGSKSFRTNFRVETGVDGATSLLRVAYTTGTISLQEGATGDSGADQTAAGNGQTTGNFAQNVQVTMEESGDHWVARIRYTNGGSLTTLVSGNINLNPNSPATYAFIANSTSTLSLWTVNENTGQPETNLLSTNIPAAMNGYIWKDAWIIATGDTAFDADTIIDDPESGDNDDSTCIFDLIGTSVVTGSAGVINPSSINVTSTPSTTCDSFLCTSDANVPEGFTAATFNFFLGLLMTIAVAAGFWFLSKSPLIMGVGALVGYLMAWAFGLVALWPLVLIAVLGVAVIFLKARPSGG